MNVPGNNMHPWKPECKSLSLRTCKWGHTLVNPSDSKPLENPEWNLREAIVLKTLVILNPKKPNTGYITVRKPKGSLSPCSTRVSSHHTWESYSYSWHAAHHHSDLQTQPPCTWLSRMTHQHSLLLLNLHIIWKGTQIKCNSNNKIIQYAWVKRNLVASQNIAQVISKAYFERHLPATADFTHHKLLPCLVVVGVNHQSTLEVLLVCSESFTTNQPADGIFYDNVVK